LEVSSSDRDEKRLALLRQTVERVGQGVRVVAPDQVDSLPEQDLVWVDAPCSGSGILRRHPEVRWLRQEKELPGLLEVQQELIKRAWAKVKSGGFFAYSVCSVLKDEGPRAIRQAGLHSELEWFLVPQAAPYGDGFWACLIRKP
jgi:16S rRNA (cytosine967-C5)-methyltransferase